MKAGFLASLSERAKAPQHSQPTSVEEDAGNAKRFAHAVFGDGRGGTRHYSKMFVGGQEIGSQVLF